MEITKPEKLLRHQVTVTYLIAGDLPGRGHRDKELICGTNDLVTARRLKGFFEASDLYRNVEVLNITDHRKDLLQLADLAHVCIRTFNALAASSSN